MLTEPKLYKSISARDSYPTPSYVPLKPQMSCHSPRNTGSFYHGPFSKGKFEIPSLVCKTEHSASSPRLLHLKAKQVSNVTESSHMRSTTLHTNTTSFLNHKTLEVDPEIIHEIPYKEHLILRTQPSKLKKLLAMTNPNSPRAPITLEPIKKEKKDAACTPSLKEYLSFLQASPKYISKSISARKPDYKLSPRLGNEILSGKQWYEQVFNRDDEPGKSSIFKQVEGGKVGSEISVTQLGTKRSSLHEIMETITDIPFSRISLTKDLPLSSNRRRSHNNGKRDEAVAKALADEVANNYRIYVSKAAKVKEFNVKMTKFLDGLGALEIFNGKINKYMPLQTRIYRDMVDLIEEQPQQPVIIEKASKNSISIVPSLKHSPSKKAKIHVRIIHAKYTMYKNISKELVDITSQLRVQALQVLEGKLLQSHEDFVQKKNEVLRNFAKSNAVKYHQMREQCEGVEDMLGKYENYDLKDRLENLEGVTKVNRETKIINKNLNGVFSNWRKTLTNEKDHEEKERKYL